jgi:CubicO group peptidase (beta-lactamase class C family)
MERAVPNHAIGRGNDTTCGESDALFPWWSITKPVLAAAVLRLADSWRLSLDNFYRDRPYTIRQLLQHTAGLNTYGAQGDPRSQKGAPRPAKYRCNNDDSPYQCP